MKQYLTPEQTAELIKIGFRAPQGSWETSENVYSIGELLSFLPKNYKRTLGITIEFDGIEWVVEWSADGERHFGAKTELIDALYEVLIELNI